MDTTALIDTVNAKRNAEARQGRGVGKYVVDADKRRAVVADLVGIFGDPEMTEREVTTRLYDELKESYLAGADITVIVVAQTCVEHILWDWWRSLGDEPVLRDLAPNPAADALHTNEREKINQGHVRGLRDLLVAAYDRGFLLAGEHEYVDAVRLARNPIVHHADINKGDSYEARAQRERSPIAELVAEDADRALITAWSFATTAAVDEVADDHLFQIAIMDMVENHGVKPAVFFHRAPTG